MRQVLIAGCGEEGPQWTAQGWSVVRLDIDPRTSPDFGRITSTVGGPRVMQFGARLRF